MKTSKPILPLPPVRPPEAHSYLRFSTPKQQWGDSTRRQIAGSEAWSAKAGIPLSKLALADKGVSALRGKNRSIEHALGQFLELAKKGDGPVRRGDYLIIENLDRLSREEERTALRLWLDILDAGINIVQLSPETIFQHERSDMTDIIRAIIELSRGHSESRMKSERVTAAWGNRKRMARENGDTITRALPAWIEERGGKRRLIPARAAVVKRIFEMGVAGYGLSSIVKRLTGEGVPPFGRSGKWVRSYVADILKDRRAVGELQPRTRYGRADDGPPIPNYFPAIVSEEQWLAARAGAAERRHKTGRMMSDRVHIFSCLLKHARDGDTICAAMQTGGRRPREQERITKRVLRNKASMEGRKPCYTFSLDVFEQAILSMLAEIDPREILNGDDGPDETLALLGQLSLVESSIAALDAELNEHGESPVLFRRLRLKEDEKRNLNAKLAEARQKAAHPLSKSWGECQSLLSALDTAPNPQDARLRLRAAVRRIIESIWLLVVPRGHARLCAAQIWFTDGTKHRDYLILHRRPIDNGAARQDGGWWAKSLAPNVAPAGLDLRQPHDAAKLETALAGIPLDALLAVMSAPQRGG